MDMSVATGSSLLAFVPKRDADGYSPITPEQGLEQVLAYLGVIYGYRKAQVIDEFCRTVAELKMTPGWDGLPEREKYARILEAMGFRSSALGKSDPVVLS
jgi:hypothetical protein